jgi:hypothetical protein
VLVVADADCDRLRPRCPHTELDAAPHGRHCTQRLHRARLPVRPRRDTRLVITDMLEREISWWQTHHSRLLKRLTYVVAATIVIDLVGTVLVYDLERHAHGTEIHSFGDALFFTTVQLLTVSSQIKNPLTTGGRIVDVFLEIWAVIVVAGSAGAIASFFQSADP